MKWLVVKFMPDLRRREPRNVGVILFAEEEGSALLPTVVLRLRGVSPEGKLDLRRARLGRQHGAVYAGWIAYWTSLATSGAPLSEWRHRSNTDAFYLEAGGELLSPMPDGSTADDLADELYELLVESPEEPADRDDGESDFKAQVESLLRRSGLLNDEHFRRRFKVDLAGLREQEFHYAWVNGHTTVGHRLNSWRSDSVDATALRLALLPAGYSSVVIVPEYPDDAERAMPIQRMSHVAAVDHLSANDLREMFLSSTADRPEDPRARFEALASPMN